MNICVATGTRAEYGLLKPLIDQIQFATSIQLKLLVTGSHLSPEFGLTYKQIEEDKITIDAKVEMLLSSDTDVGIVKSMGLAMIGFADALNNLEPDILVILGDRFEMLALASAALIFKIPIAHIHGGEITEGAYDNSIRHAISKLSHLHFTSTESYRQRIIQMGENPNSVINVGAIGLDNITNLKLLTKNELEINLGIKFLKYNYLVTFHPATLDEESPEHQFKTILRSIKNEKDSFFIFTKANADTNGRIINQLIDEFVIINENSIAFSSLGTLRFLSALKICDALVGNSSSGIIEAPSLKTPTINIGKRQQGRIQAESTVNCNVSEIEINAAFKKVKTADFILKTNMQKNPYGNGDVAKKIVEVIKNSSFKKNIMKPFFNLNQ